MQFHALISTCRIHRGTEKHCLDASEKISKSTHADANFRISLYLFSDDMRDIELILTWNQASSIGSRVPENGANRSEVNTLNSVNLTWCEALSAHGPKCESSGLPGAAGKKCQVY